MNDWRALRYFTQCGGDKVMKELGDSDKILYFQRSYVAVDGLWFMKTEEAHGFEEALERDCDVWKVMPKIQVRMLKAMTGADQGIEGLRHCLAEKFKAEGFSFETTKTDEKGFTFTISVCPWYDTLVKAGRTQVAAKIGENVCKAEYTVWANEFGDAIRFENTDKICNGEPCCAITFRDIDR